jgi:hypothetical protein|tara:strand:- start:1022 stop:1330 length:309 start_codon:yes stop_codon:yes gene_type:complete
MDYISILEKFGIPLSVAIFFGFFIWKQNKFIQDELQKELRESFSRVENIIVKLIDQQKKMQLEQKGIENSYKTLVEVIAKLSGNGLRDKFLRMQERNENKKY